MTNLSETLTKHRLWLQGDPSGERANLYRAVLSGAKIRVGNRAVVLP